MKVRILLNITRRVVIATAIGAASISAAPSAALAANSGFGYDNTDPVATGCNADAVTVASASVYGTFGSVIGKVELRWSNRCGTNWTRVTSYNGNQAIWADVHRVSPSAATGWTGMSTVVWTNQLYARGVCAWADGGVPQYGTTYSAQTATAC